MRHGWMRLAALACVAALLAGGCTTLVENNNIGDLPSLSPPVEAETVQMRTIKPALYFIDAGTGRLAVETREIELSFAEEGVAAVVGALLEGPVGKNLRPLAASAQVEGVEIADEIANVYVATGDVMSPVDRFNMCVAIADTVVDYSGVTYVCVFVNGDVLHIGGMPCGVLKKSDGNLPELYKDYVARYAPGEAEQAPAEQEIDMVLYYLDATGNYIRPEVRRVHFSGGDYIPAVLAALSEGAEYKYSLNACISRELLLDTTVTAKQDAGLKQLSIRSDGEIFAGSGDENMTIQMAALYYTLAGLLPQTYRIISENDGHVRSMTRRVASAYLGQSISLSMPDSQSSTLVNISRTVAAGDAEDFATYIRELIRGPLEVDPPNAAPAFPKDIIIEDLRGISLSGNVASVDFSAHFASQMRKLSTRQQRQLIYSIVNTLASTNRVKMVQFYIEGNKVEDLGGHMDLSSPLMPNPGLQ